MIRALCHLLVFLLLLGIVLSVAGNPGGTCEYARWFAEGWRGRPPTVEMLTGRDPMGLRGWKAGNAAFEAQVNFHMHGMKADAPTFQDET